MFEIRKSSTEKQETWSPWNVGIFTVEATHYSTEQKLFLKNYFKILMALSDLKNSGKVFSNLAKWLSVLLRT